MIADLDSAWDAIIEGALSEGRNGGGKGAASPPIDYLKVRKMLGDYHDIMVELIAYGQKGAPFPKRLIPGLQRLHSTLCNILGTVPEEIPSAAGPPQLPRASARQPKALAPARISGRPASTLSIRSSKISINDVVKSGPLRFDPSGLYKEFGREAVLAKLVSIPADKRPESAAALRLILMRKEGVS